MWMKVLILVISFTLAFSSYGYQRPEKQEDFKQQYLGKGSYYILSFQLQVVPILYLCMRTLILLIISIIIIHLAS